MLHCRHQTVGVVLLSGFAPHPRSSIVVEKTETRLVGKDHLLPLLVPCLALFTSFPSVFDFFFKSGFLQATQLESSALAMYFRTVFGHKLMLRLALTSLVISRRGR